MATPSWAVEAIVQAGRRMDARGWVPATAGNLSVRLDPERIAITRSGCHKGFLVAGDVMEVDYDGRALTQAAPSAETALHCQIYRHDSAAGAIVHGHSVAATVLGLGADSVRLAGYELLKVFHGQTTHDAALELPVVANDQDMGRLAGVIAPLLQAGTPLGYLIRRHGVYVWGPDMPTALARLEGLEFLLACELERRKIGR